MSMDSGIKLKDLNDFILPAEKCTKPLITTINNNETTSLLKKTRNDAKENKTNIGKLNLDDCLACSGCITSAETVFIEQQSADEFLKYINDNKELLIKKEKALFVSVSVHSLLSLSQSLDLKLEDIISIVQAYFKTVCHAELVFNSNEINSICIMESTEEFIRLYKKSEKSCRIFSSSCPGWVCYAEKRCGNEITSSLSRTRSTQAVFGAIVKRMGVNSNFDARNLIHLSVQPCFDRKLESVRKEFKVYDSEQMLHNETDYVLTTNELYNLIIDYCKDDLSILNKNEEFTQMDSVFDYLDISSLTNKSYARNIGGESGGLATNVFINACKELFGLNCFITNSILNGVEIETLDVTSDDYEIQNKFIKGSDFHEIVLLRKDALSPSIMLRFLKVYGFRNIQNLFVRLKKFPEINYHYTEIMACPNGGCLNGGGQILFHSNLSIVERNKKLKELRNSFVRLPTSSPETKITALKLVEMLKSKEISLTAEFKSLENDSSNVSNATHW